ncbi:MULTISPECIES: HlyD family secretion protein [Microbulbifer]|uniref:HlyD family secretion protein n=1 Tax=Microbulbifer celer TaxID=435905 RepID=A0ABW3U700_9GAMM|nr:MULTISPECIES: HlyD family secretion protein [Microbulbifer]UFN58786.1 HlyD family secretion protein [Microbulbifer celer]
MNPEQHFSRWIKIASTAFAVLFVYFVVADMAMPLTPQARAMREINQVAPEVSGKVIAVAVKSHSQVQRGDVLFQLDPEPYRIAVERAELAVEQAKRDNARLDASIDAAKAALRAASADADELAQEHRRLGTLIADHTVSQQQLDRTAAAHAAAISKVDSAKAKLSALRLERGDAGEENLQLRQAHNQLAEARLNLARATVRATQDGVVSNLQLEPGDYAAAGSPALVVVGNTLDITADFREKSLRNVRSGDQALISFDAIPGRIFTATANGIDAGVRDGQLLANGQLVDIPSSNRWVRDAQRLRLHLALVSELDALPASGARATVQLIPEGHPVAAFFAHMQIRLVSLLHFLY